MATAQTLEIALADEAATGALAAAFARAIEQLQPQIARQGLTVTLHGELGSGKTSLVRALLRNLGVQGPVKSPTYALLELYEVLKLNFYHFDFYRFKSPEEFRQGGFAEFFGAGHICFVEWPERAGNYLPPVDCRIEMSIEDGVSSSHGDAPRRASMRGSTQIGEQCVAILKNLQDRMHAGA